MKVQIIDYGMGNLGSVKTAVGLLGFNADITSIPNSIESADKIILPGVGSFNDAMSELRSGNWIEAINEHVLGRQKPILGICLGMQLFCEITEEQNTKGLGIINSKVKLFSNKRKVPQIGWNKILNLRSPLFNGISENEYMYLVHSYYVPVIKETVAQSCYGINYSVSILSLIHI